MFFLKQNFNIFFCLLYAANCFSIREETAQKDPRLDVTPNRDFVSAVFDCFDKLFLCDLQIKAVLTQIIKHSGHHITKHIDDGIVC